MNIAEQVKTANKAVYDNAEGVTLLCQDISITHPAEQQRIRRVIASISPGGGEKKFLDLGTGYGNVLRIAKGYFEYSLGCDLNFYPLAALKKEHPSLPLVCCEAEKLAFKDGAFDCICIFSVLHHIADYGKVLGEAARVTKRGGYLYIDHENNYYFSRYARGFLRFLMSFSARDREIMLANFHAFMGKGMNPELIRQELAGLGFSEIKLEYRFTSRSYAFVVFLLKLISKIYPFKSCYTHFSIVAKK
jgi:ubiquinone/menaquinone biosynthesis C-methylase UbiE